MRQLVSKLIFKSSLYSFSIELLNCESVFMFNSSVTLFNVAPILGLLDPPNSIFILTSNESDTFVFSIEPVLLLSIWSFLSSLSSKLMLENVALEYLSSSLLI